ncbi:MAG: hypothetical protein ACI86H_002041 [bacterium]|jgi:hypothetical protein
MEGKKGFFVKLGFFIVLMFTLVFLATQVIDSNKADSHIVLQTITGKLTIISKPGPYLRFFGTPHYYKKAVAVNFTGKRKTQASSVLPKIKVRFSDTSLGDAMGVVRFRLPVSANKLAKIHKDFGSQAALLSNLLERVVTEAAKASSRIMSVEQHYTGGASQMTLDFSDQLQNGIFITEKITKKTIVTDRNDKTKTRIQRKTFIIKRLTKAGRILRSKNNLLEYGITLISASIEDVDYESRVNQRLASQKQAAADEALARGNLKKAQQEALTAEALGQKAIAEARAVSDRQKIQAEIKAQQNAAVATINAKRKVEVARQTKIQAEIRAQEQAAVAKIGGQKLVEISRQQNFQQAQIFEKQKKEAAGLRVLAQARKFASDSALDPQKVFEMKLSAWKQVQITKYQYMSRAQLVPTIQMGGSGKGGKSNAMTLLELLGVKAANDLGMQFQQMGKRKRKQR